MRRRTSGNEHGYKNVELKMTKEEWWTWAKPRITEFLEKNPTGIPSVDISESSLWRTISSAQNG